jgi:hypothetical protein
MQGTNSMDLNEATMVVILQHYFDTVLFSSGKSPKVTSVKRSNDSGYTPDFEVTMESKEAIS